LILIATLLCVAHSVAATHYSVRLTPDFVRGAIRGVEQVRTTSRGGLTKGAKLRVIRESPGRYEYEVEAGRGLHFLPDRGGLYADFYCEAWMVCNPNPDQRATLRLEMVLPESSGLEAVGPGELVKQWRDGAGFVHFVFVQDKPVQTFLFSFAVARMERMVAGHHILYGGREATVRKTGAAWAFLQEKAGVELPFKHYTQAFIPFLTYGQEAAALALMPQNATEDDGLIAHELAHQWWAVLVGIRSWSDFWLNEGFAEYMTLAYLEHREGRASYDEAITKLRERLQKLPDRPLHWEQWKDAHDALGSVPYVKGALFLDKLRGELGDNLFWQGIALYTRRNAHHLVGSRDFQHAMEDASHRDLGPLFERGVYQ
jgi:aminopeptidase N